MEGLRNRKTISGLKWLKDVRNRFKVETFHGFNAQMLVLLDNGIV